MNVNYKNGTYALVDQANFDAIPTFMEDPEVKSVSLHKPGDIVETNGGRFEVSALGMWRKVGDGKKIKHKRKAARNARRRNR